MNILLLSLGGGGGNILRSVKALYQRDLAVAEQADPAYAARLRRSVATRFADTNRFSLVDVPDDERVLIGAATTGLMGARHDPEVARRAFEESKAEIEELIDGYSTVIVIATGGKGTGTGTMVPAALLARAQKKLVIPIFVRPSFERHEVEKQRYDQALDVSRRLDAAQIRFIEILNDRGYADADPQPQSVVWERMNVPIARALRGLLYVLWDLSQVDPSDLSSLFAGPGRLRISFSELEPSPGTDPADHALSSAVQDCWENPFCNFSGPVGTSLVCIQGPWSNVADAKIKSGLAAHAVTTGSAAYNPLYARAFQMPQPWGVTALFAEHTGNHPPIDVNWSLESPAATEVRTPPRVIENEKVEREKEKAEGRTAGASRDSAGQLLGSRAGNQPLRSCCPRDRAERRERECERRSGRAQEAARNRLVPLGLPTPLERVARSATRCPHQQRRRSEPPAEARAPGHSPAECGSRRSEGALLEVVGDRGGPQRHSAADVDRQPVGTGKPRALSVRGRTNTRDVVEAHFQNQGLGTWN